MTKANNKQTSQKEKTHTEIEEKISRQMSTGFDRIPDSWSIQKIVEMGDKLIDPDYQRGAIWDRPKQKALIETIIRYGGDKIPTVTLRKVGDDSYEIVDGKQRLLTSIIPFVQDEFRLTGVYNKDLNGVNCSDLKTDWSMVYGSFMNCKIPVEIMNNMSDEDAITYFIQINSSGVNMTIGEKIHAMQGTPIIQTIDSLIDHPVWDKITRKMRFNQYWHTSRMLLFVRDTDVNSDEYICYSQTQLLNQLDEYREVEVPKTIVKSVKDTFDFLNKCFEKYEFKVTIAEFVSIFLYVNKFLPDLTVSTFGKFLYELYYRIHSNNPNNLFRIIKTQHTTVGCNYTPLYYKWYVNLMGYMYDKYVNGGSWDDISRLSVKR